jgi:small subunit ribosomal protein S20
MANSKSAEKRARVSERRRDINRRKASKARTATRSLKILVGENKLEEAAKSLPAAQSALDKAVKSGTIKATKASRLKSRLAKSLKTA